MAIIIFDPRNPEAVPMGDAANLTDLEHRARALRDRLYEERRTYVVAVIHRRTHDVRWWDLNPKRNGSLSVCCELLRGHWRLASSEEEAEAEQVKEDARIARAQSFFERREKAAEVLAQDAGFSSKIEIVKGAKNPKRAKNSKGVKNEKN